MKTSEELRAAHDYMAEHGKCEGMVEDSQGRVCAVGALDKAVGHMSYRHRGYIVQATGNTAITLWSDSNDISTVLDGLLKAAKLADDQGELCPG